MMQNLPPSLRAKGPKELQLSHVSQTTYAITLKNVDGHLLSNILATVKVAITLFSNMAEDTAK